MRRSSVLAAVLLASGLCATAVAAAEAARVRLVVGSVEEGRVAAGLAIDLPEGWKTYWRTPGDAGIPPSLDSAGSTGLGPIAVRFPAPERFDEAGLTALGYTRSVVLPIETRLADPATPGRLVLTVMIGLCHDICIPFETRVEATIAPGAAGDAAAAAAIAAAAARVPRPAEAASGPRVLTVRPTAGPNGPRLVAEIATAAEAPDRDVFVEGPSGDWSLPQPERVGAAGPRETWAFDLDGAPRGADLAAVDLRFTIRVGDRAVEQVVRVDARPTAP
jgi:DsbC/DsbD-like thiol-disulfide interchange protein